MEKYALFIFLNLKDNESEENVMGMDKAKSHFLEGKKCV
jgi:hypothetical protein